MPSDFEAELRNSLQDLNGKVAALSKTFSGSKEQARQFGDEVKKSFHRETFKEAGEGAEDLKHEIREVGEAIKGAGGMVGELAHALTGGLRFAGPIAAIAIAAKTASVAFDVLNDRAESTMETIKKVSEAADQMGDAIYDANRKAADSQISETDKLDRDIRILTARGGKTAMDKVNTIAKGNYGVTYEQAASGVAELYNVPQRYRVGVEGAALEAAKTGEVNFADAVKKISENPFLMAGVNASGQPNFVSERSVAQRLIMQERGLIPNNDNRNAVSAEFGASDEQGLVAGRNAIVSSRNGTTANAVSALSGPTLRDAAVTTAANAANPTNELMRVLNERMERTEALHKEQVKAMSKVVWLLQDMNRMTFGKGPLKEMDDETKALQKQWDVLQSQQSHKFGDN